MSWIVVLESEGRQTESLREGLAEDGWLVEATSTYESAAAAVSQRSPQLVLANAELPRAAELLSTSSRAHGGPGSVALVPPGATGTTAAEAADERLVRPFSDHDLRLMVRRMVTTGRAGKTPPPASDGERLTSRDLFGDLLEEFEGAPAAPARTAPAPAADARIDRTLSNLLQAEKAKPSAPRRAEPGVDDLLSKTLSGLDVGERTKRAPAPKPASQAAKATAPPGPPPAAAAKPAPPTVKPAAKPVAKPAGRPASSPSVDRRLADLTPPPSAPSRRATKDLDLSSLDAYAKGAAHDRTPTAPESLATQKIAVPGSLRAVAGPIEFGQYTLLERIALGGMAEVWKARMKGVEGFQKTVAIKKILPHLTDSSDFVTMFIDEAKLAAQLNHTNIIHIYDLGKIGEDFYIAMEFVDGKDLRTILNTARDAHSPVPLGLALLVASRLASALDHAHRKKDFEGHAMGLVHRDVSPQNVLISFDGDIKLCDFGIVKAVAKASKTQMGALKGKLQYMSPEQAWGRPVDGRSDIFSLGTLLFEMLTGRRLFMGESEMSVLDAVREGRIQAPRDLDPRIPLEVNALVLRALAREPKDRFQSAGDLQREIDGILGSHKPSPSQRELAHYMQKLFGSESRPAVPAATVAPAPVAAAPRAASEPRPEAAATAAPAVAAAAHSAEPDAALESAAGGQRKMLWIGIAAVLAIGVGIVFLRGGTKSEEATPAQSPAEASAAPAATAPAGPSDAAAKPAAEPTRKDAAAEPPRAESAKPPVTAKPERAEPAEKPAAEPARATPEPAASEPAPTETTASQPAPAAVVEVPPEPAAEPAREEPSAPVAPAPTRAAEPEPAAPEPKVSAVREGDLVPLGAGVTPPVLVSVSKPEYPAMARRTRVEGTVVLSLLVDENGRVIDVRLQRGVSLNVGINEAAIAAARTAKYRPATKDGVRVKTWHQLTIPFKL